MAKSVHFSSKTCEWATPQDLFDKLDSDPSAVVIFKKA